MISIHHHLRSIYTLYHQVFRRLKTEEGKDFHNNETAENSVDGDDCLHSWSRAGTIRNELHKCSTRERAVYTSENFAAPQEVKKRISAAAHLEDRVAASETENTEVHQRKVEDLIMVHKSSSRESGWPLTRS